MNFSFLLLAAGLSHGPWNDTLQRFVTPQARVDYARLAGDGLPTLDAYLATRAVPAPDTLFDGVKKVRPASRVSITPGGHLEETTWWSPPACDPEGTWSHQLGRQLRAAGLEIDLDDTS